MEKQIHFGWWLRRQQELKFGSLREFAAAADRTPERIGQAYRSAQECSQHLLPAVAKALGMTPGELSQAWKREPVSKPYFKETKTRKFTVSIEDAEDLRAMLAWFRETHPKRTTAVSTISRLSAPAAIPTPRLGKPRARPRAKPRREDQSEAK